MRYTDPSATGKFETQCKSVPYEMIDTPSTFYGFLVWRGEIIPKAANGARTSYPKCTKFFLVCECPSKQPCVDVDYEVIFRVHHHLFQPKIWFFHGFSQCLGQGAGQQGRATNVFRFEGALGWRWKMRLDHCNIYWLVVWNMNFIFPYIGNNNPNWLAFSYFYIEIPSGKLTFCYGKIHHFIAG